MSMTKNGVSTTKGLGEERYERFRAGRVGLMYQYDYRHTNGDLFSTVAQTLRICRERRDTWLQGKDWNGLPDDGIKSCQHRKGQMIDFNEETFVGTWKCRVCGQPFSRQASIVCMEAAND